MLDVGKQRDPRPEKHNPWKNGNIPMKIFVDYIVITIKMTGICIAGALTVYGIASILPKPVPRSYIALGFPVPVSPEVFVPHPLPPPSSPAGPKMV